MWCSNHKTTVNNKSFAESMIHHPYSETDKHVTSLHLMQSFYQALIVLNFNTPVWCKDNNYPKLEILNEILNHGEESFNIFLKFILKTHLLTVQ